MPAPLAILDANVLYPQLLRDLFLSLAEAKLFGPLWSDRILAEWVRNVLADRPDLTPDRLTRTCDLMAEYFPDALVAGFEPRIDELFLPDPDDRHVLAAAIEAGASHLVTFNLADFPVSRLSKFNLAVVHPDEFV